MFLQNTQRTGATIDPRLSVANASTLKLKWAFKAGGPIATSVSIVGTTAYVGSWDGYEYAISTVTGAQIWKSPSLGITTDPGCNPVNIGITSAADVENGVLYVGGGGPYWYALNATTGAILWSVYTGDNSQTGAHYNWSSPLIYNGFAFIAVASNCDNPLVQGHLMQVSLATHQVVNDYAFVSTGELGGGVWTTPAVDPSTNTIFVTTGTLNDYTQTQSQAIVTLDATTLAYKGSWQLPFQAAVADSDWGTSPTLTTAADGTPLVSAANKNGIVYTWKRSDLELGKPDLNPPLWQTQIAIGGDCPTCGDGSIASGAFANGVLYYAGGHQVVNGRGSGGTINAINPTTGAVLWTHQTEGPVIGAVAYVNGEVAYGQGNTFEVVNAANGQLLYSYVLPGPTYSAVSVARSQFYIGDINGSVYAFGIPGTPPPPPPPDPNCPATLNAGNPAAGPVTCQDVRSPGIAGSESTKNGVLTVTASGAAIHGTSDQFRLISAPVSGDSQSSVEITAQSTQNAQPQAGLMMRQSNDPASPFYAVIAYPNDLTEGNPLADLVFWYRTAWGSASIELTKLYPATKPIWVMIQRVGNLFSAGVSQDGVHYTLIPGSTADVNMPATLLGGLAVDSGASTNSGTASFANISVGSPLATTMAPQFPTDPCPSAWTCSDIGNPNPPGDTTSSSPASFTVSGTGTGINGASDSFHYVYQSVSGNQTLSSRVVTQLGAPATAHEGIMMRANSSPTSPFYAVLFTPGGTATVTWRYYDGIADRTGVLPLPSVPASTNPTTAPYVQISSYLNPNLSPPNFFFSTQTSTDGVNWTPVLGSTQAIPMGTQYLAGMAADAESPRVTVPVVFNGVTLAPTGTPPSGICPTGFACTDIGNAILTGNQLYINPQQPVTPASTGVWTIQAGGSDLWSTFDNFRYAYENFPNDPQNSVNGDGTVSARVVSQTNPNNDGWIKTGVMIRGQSGADPQAPYYGVFVSSGNGVMVQWRSAESALTNQLLATPGAGNSTIPPITPIYVLAERYTDPTSGTVYYAGFTSADDVHWTWIPGSTVALNITGFLTSGIATDSHNEAGYSVATVDNLAELAGASPPPGVCPGGWSCTDVGGPLPPGQDTLMNGTWSEVGGGGDIWTSSDSFHLVAQSLAADGSVTAHVTTQQNTNPFAKTGPMMRATTDPGSPYYGVFVTPTSGVAVQWRTAQGAATNQLLVGGKTPIYLKVTRYTTVGTSPQTFYTAYTSPDGVTWTAIPGSTQAVTMPGAILAGFAITSHNQGAGSAVTLDTVGVSSVEPSPPPGVCAGPWSCTDIGGPLPPGQDSLTNGTWSEVGGGGDIWTSSDAFHFVSQPLPADGSVTAHVTAQQNTNPWAKAGVMMRATTDPGSPYYGVFVTPNNGVAVQWRSAQGAVTNQTQANGNVAIYLKVTRYTTTGASPQTFYTAYTSPDGITWTAIAGSTQAITMPGAILAGFAITSHNQGTGSAVTLDTVGVSSAEPPVPPGVCPGPWSCTDIGGPLPAGQDSLANGTWNEIGGGGDIWSISDAFHFVSQSLVADGSVTAHVTAQQATSPWAKAGVMVRASTDPGSPYYGVFVTPSNGVAVQWRTAQGAVTNQILTSGRTPLYLEATRYTTTGTNPQTLYAAYTSPDGVTWTEVPGSTQVVSMPGALLAGFAITSHNQGTGSAVTLDTIGVSNVEPPPPS
jgi:outer membrane protein assembly factor BamB